MQVVLVAAHLFFALAGIGMVFLGAWGSLRIGRHGVDTVLAPKQRFFVSMMGLLFLAASWYNMSGWLPIGF